MKKIIVIAMLLTSQTLFANAIPGWLELGINAQDWTGIGANKGYGKAEIDIIYGARLWQVKPYLHVNTSTWFQAGHMGYNAPFRDIYTLGAGIRIYDFLYVEYTHKCAHYVRTKGSDANRLYESLPGTAHNIITVGLRFKID